MTRIRAMQWGALAAGISFALTVFAVLALQGSGTQPATTAQSLPATLPVVPVPPDDGNNLRVTNDVRVYRKVKDAIVNITSSRIMTARVSSGNDLFDHMMPDALPTRQVQAQSLGSGFVIHSAGYIITNEHVVEEGTDVQCVFASGEKLAAQVIATDNEHDLAVLKVIPPEGKPLPAVTLGSSEDLMIGEPVYAIGNPFGYASTMTSGIISALNRSLSVSSIKSYTGLIQTDASINPGNSGGPLINAYGQVIGINTAIRADAQGIGFAISVSNMRDLLPAFLNPEVLNRAQIGFTLKEHRTVGWPASVTAQVVVNTVQTASDAFMKGLREGDVITSVDGVTPDNVVDALVALANSKPGDDLVLRVQRGTGADGRQMSLEIPVTKAPPAPVDQLLLSKMGITAQTVTPALAAKFSLAVNSGIYIDSVLPSSPAARCGLQTGDVLIQLGRYYVNSTDDVAALLKTVTQPVDARVGIVRGNARGAGTISLQ